MAYTGVINQRRGKGGGGELSCLAGQAVVRRNYATTGKEGSARASVSVRAFPSLLLFPHFPSIFSNI